MEFLKKGNKIVFLGHAIPNGDSFKVDIHLTKKVNILDLKKYQKILSEKLIFIK